MIPVMDENAIAFSRNLCRSSRLFFIGIRKRTNAYNFLSANSPLSNNEQATDGKKIVSAKLHPDESSRRFDNKLT